MKRILPFIVILLVFAGIYGYKQYYRTHEDLSQKKAEITVTSDEIFNAFATNEAVANTAYLDKIIAVNGKIVTVKEEDNVIQVILESDDMMFGVICKMDATKEYQTSDFLKGSSVTLQGVCSGYLMDVVLNRCVQIK